MPVEHAANYRLKAGMSVTGTERHLAALRNLVVIGA
jgi:hypothetical protein